MVQAASDISGPNIGPIPVVLSDAEVLAAASACNTNPSCESFNTDMTLKGSSSITGISASQGGCLYIRQGNIKIEPDDRNTCLVASSQAYCNQCAQSPQLSDQVSCYRCLNLPSLSSSQCLDALLDGRLSDYLSGLIETIYDSTTSSEVKSLCSSLQSGSTSGVFSSDNLLRNTLLAVQGSWGNATQNTSLRLKIDDATPTSKFLIIKYSPNCSSISGYFRPNATGNWTFLAYGNDGLHLWVGEGFRV